MTIWLRLLDLQMFTILDKFPNVLQALLGGPNMRFFETLSDEILIDDCMWMLEKFLKKSLPQPIAMQRTKWLTSENFYGSYSYFSTKAGELNITSKDLATTLYNKELKPEVIFAGEHTDDLYSSNAHGAVRSGYQAANEVIEFYKKK
jgi:monoamine oxidase